jgi:hypothetical protein
MKCRSVLPLCLGLIGFSCFAQQEFEPVSTLDAPAIQGRPVELDASGKLLPWPSPDDAGASYEAYFTTQWSYLRQQYHGPRYYYFYCCVDFDRKTFATAADHNWVNSTAYLRAMMQGFVEHLYAYTGDAETIRLLQDFVDYELANGTTPLDYAWAGVPYASADPGAATYRGWSKHAVDFVEPPIVGEDGYAYLRLYEMTGEQRYLQAALRCADALVKNIRNADADHSPWPVRVYARDGRIGKKAMGAYSANVIEPIELLDELIRLQRGGVAAYRRVREQAWRWLRDYPMQNNVWVGYFEDVPPNMQNMNNVIPLETARYVLLHPELDPDWKRDAAQLIQWVKTTPKWPKYIVHGATVTTEQGDGHKFCCGKPNTCCDSHTARLAAVEAIYYWKTQDEAYKEQAFRSFNWVTYVQGFPPKGDTPWGPGQLGQWWFTDEFTDGPRRMMDGLWAVPTWAPQDSAHFLGTSSVVSKIRYARDAVSYSTFDAAADDVLRLDFVPTTVTAGAQTLLPVSDLSHDGYSFDAATHVMRVHHATARDISILGDGGTAPTAKVDFDYPRLTAATILRGQYPRGIIDWGRNTWQVHVPAGRFSTFHVRTRDPQARHADFSFVSARVFSGLTVVNDGDTAVMLKIRATGNADIETTIAPGQWRRLHTLWDFAVTKVSIDADYGATLGSLSFDDFAYVEDAAKGSVAHDLGHEPLRR